MGYNELLDLIENDGLSALEQKLLKRVSYDVVGPKEADVAMWILSSGIIVNTARHRDAIEMLKVDWDEWLKTGVVRVTKYSGGLAVEKYPGVAISDSQILSIMEILRAMDGIKLYIEARSEEATRTEDVKKVKLGDSNRVFLRQAIAALKGIK